MEITCITVDCADPATVADFWNAALRWGGVAVADDSSGAICGPPGGGVYLEFVRVPELDATNNAAERRLRPLVIARKISGGSRSPQGTATRLDLAGLFQTWHARGLNPFAACYALLHSGLPQL